jgi:hypothetical protein
MLVGAASTMIAPSEKFPGRVDEDGRRPKPGGGKLLKIVHATAGGRSDMKRSLPVLPKEVHRNPPGVALRFLTPAGDFGLHDAIRDRGKLARPVRKVFIDSHLGEGGPYRFVGLWHPEERQWVVQKPFTLRLASLQPTLRLARLQPQSIHHLPEATFCPDAKFRSIDFQLAVIGAPGVFFQRRHLVGNALYLGEVLHFGQGVADGVIAREGGRRFGGHHISLIHSRQPCIRGP